MPFQLKPQVYSLQLCHSIKEDRKTGGWIVQPFSEVGVYRVPVTLNLTVFAQIMGPPGGYELGLRLFHTADPEGSVQVMVPRPFTLYEGKNIDFLLKVDVRITQLGLYMLQANIPEHHTTYTPLRITNA